MPAIKKEQVLDDSVKKAFDDLNASIKLSVDTLVDMTKKAKLINEQMGSGSNISQMSKATADYNANLKEQAISEQEVIKLERQKIALEKDKLALESAKKKAADSELKAAKLKEDALKREAKANETAAQKAEQARQREVLAAQKAADAITKEDNKRAASAKKASDAIVEAARKAEADIAKSDAKTASLKAKADSQAIKDAERKAKADEKEAKAAKKKAEQTAKESTEYYKLSKAYREADKAAKEAGAEFGVNSKQFKKAKEEASKLGEELNGLNRELGHSQDNVGNYKSVLDGIKTAFGFVGVAIGAGTAALWAFDKAITTNQIAGDAWARTMQSVNSTVDVFFKMISTGNLDGFTQRLFDAAKAGRELADALDDMFETGLSVDVMKSQTDLYVAQQEQIRDDVTKTKDERIKAALNIIQAENKLLESTQSSAQKQYDAYANYVKDAIKIDDQKLISFIANYQQEEELRERASKKLDELTRTESARKIAQQAVDRGIGSTKDVVSIDRRISEIRSSFSTAEAVYAEFLKKYGELSDEEITNMINAYNNLTGVQTDNLKALAANNKKLSKLKKGQLDDDEKENKKKIDEEKKVTKDLIKLKEEEIQKAKDVDATNAHEIAVREQKVNKLEEELKALKKIQELAIAKPISIELEKVDFDDINAKALASAKEQTANYKDELDQQIEDLKAAAEQKADIQMQWVDTVSSGVEEMESAMWDNIATGREDAMNAEIEAMQERLDNENLDEEQRAEIQKQIDEKEKQLKIKNAKAEKNEALMKIGIDTLMAVAKIKAQMAILASNPLTVAYAPIAAMQIPFVIASGAMSAAAVSMRKIPEYAEGTDFHQGGYAVVGDGGKHELVETPSGAKYLTPNTDTLINLERGSKVVSGDEVNERLAELTRNEIVNMALPSSIDKYQHSLINKLISEQMKTTKAVNSISMPQPLNIEKAIRFETFKQRLKN